jgi:atlastin
MRLNDKKLSHLSFHSQYRSLNFPGNSLSNSGDWMGGEDDPLTGFSWKSGSVRDTTGIVMWSDVFLHTDDDTGDDLAIILMDSQGLFDSDTTSADNSRILALSLLMSSIQIININDIIQEDQLQYLQVTKFGD